MNTTNKKIIYENEKLKKEIDELFQKVKELAKEAGLKPWEKILLIFCLIVFIKLSLLVFGLI